MEPALLLQCLTTGLADGLAYSATQTWVGFMTGNLVQLVLAAFSLPDTMRRLLCSLSAIGGFSIGADLAARFQPSRTALIASSILRAALTLTLTLVGIAYADFNLNGERAPVVLALVSTSRLVLRFKADKWTLLTYAMHAMPALHLFGDPVLPLLPSTFTT